MAGKIFKYLPKSTSFSVSTSNNNASSPRKANFSGPIAPLIPKEARRAKRNDDGNNDGFEAREPTSPKVTCIGQVKKHKKKHEEKKKKKVEKEEVGPKKSGIRGMFQKKARPPVAEAATTEVVPMMRRLASGRERTGEVVPELGMMRKFASGRERMGEVVPELGMMRKFASGRETLVDFDWRDFVVVDEEEEERR